MLITCFIGSFTLKGIPVDCIFAQWKWAYILEFGPWRWGALNVGFVDKWPSRMQGQWFNRSQTSGQQFSVESRNSRFFGWAAAPARIYLPWKVRGGELNVPLIGFFSKFYIDYPTRQRMMMFLVCKLGGETLNPWTHTMTRNARLGILKFSCLNGWRISWGRGCLKLC